LAALWRTLALVLALLLLGVTWPASAHPEDEFCTPGEDGMDPALCIALRELDRPGDVSTLATNTAPLIERSAWSTFTTYVAIGTRHILPGGLDHILFVLAFFLSSVRLRALLWQIGAFTVAHTVTLGLVAGGVLTPPAAIVEPFIALSIVWVAVENLLRDDTSRYRLALVFAFGLVHGMGFAGFFGELGLPSGQFFSALVGFNVGVEIGQLAVIAVALLLTFWLRPRAAGDGRELVYRRWVVRPVSAAIALVALVWFFQRILG